MGLNRMMMRNGEVQDGSQKWHAYALNNVIIPFTVPPGVKRIKVEAVVNMYEDGSDVVIYTSIENTSNNKVWGDGWFNINFSRGRFDDYQNIDSIVGVTPNKTYKLLFDCYETSGVTFSWGKEINKMTPTVEDY